MSTHYIPQPYASKQQTFWQVIPVDGTTENWPGSNMLIADKHRIASMA